MSYNYRELVESLDAIMAEEEVPQEENGIVVQEDSDNVIVDLLKEITTSLVALVDKAKEEGSDHKEIAEKLKKACDILADVEYNDDLEAKDSTKEIEEDFGTEDMAPKVDSEGHRSYKVKDAPSYAARQGFVGM
ncbi:hypothetical protein FOI42_RS04200 [Escherichia coli]|nr:hypothetical protein [Escherichia coli]EFL4883668.1 hypothetical protein [Escherichia coli]MED6699517.1 hypothetical protein [Escherichia coli O157]HCQ0858477.1 hypothetical protein [Escherichia coli]